MGEKDIAERTLESFADVFADMLNVIMFKGEQIAKPEELSAALPRSQLKMSDGLHEQERDAAMYWRGAVVKMALLGFENQTSVDRLMPLRLFAYDGAACKEMMQKGLPLGPVITFVLYFGWKKRWDGPKSLHECFNVPEILRPFAQDYRIHVFEAAFLEPEQIALFSSDFKFAADYLRCRRLGLDYNPAHLGKVAHVHELLQFMHAMSGDHRFETVYNREIMKDGEVTMCELLDRIEARGVSRGIAEGRSLGMAEGRSLGMAEGRSKTKERDMAIFGELLSQGRLDDALRMTRDSAYYDRVMRERFGD